MTLVRALLFSLILFLASPAQSATFYVKPTGTGTATGSSVANAIGAASVMAAASPGDTLRYCGGYGTFGSIVITVEDLTLLSCDDTGAYSKWSANVEGSAGVHGIYTNDGVDGATIIGFKILSAYIDGIKNNGNRCTNQWNWVANAGRGDPAWSTNTAGTYTGNGIAAHNKSDFDISFNLVEKCGANLTQDHGFYGGGTNGRIHGNIFRTNDCGWGIQVFDSTGDNHNVWVTGNLLHDNGTQNGAGTQGGLVIYTYGVKTNYIVGNTILTSGNRYGMIMNQAHTDSRLGLTNNIISGNAGYGVTVASGAGGTNSVWSNYNLKSSIISTEPQGANDVAGTALWDSTANARYWHTYDSPARVMALGTACPTVDFFGRSQLIVTDVGHCQFEDMLANDDSRNLGDGARDPWVREPGNVRVSVNPTHHIVRWNEMNDQHTGYYISRKDSVNNVYVSQGFIAKGTKLYSDPVSGMTNGVTYTYTLTPETSLGNSGGLHSIEASAICDKLSTLHAHRVLNWGTNITGYPSTDNVTPTWTNWCDITVLIPGTNIVAVADGTTDNTTAFETAWALCPSNSVIYVPAGDYAFGSRVDLAIQSLTANNNKVIRGAGTNLTRFFGKTSSAGWASSVSDSLFQLGSFNEQGTQRTISAALAKGATQLTLPGGYGVIPIVPGTIIKIWEGYSDGKEGASLQGGDADPNYNSNDGSTYSVASAPKRRDVVVVTSVPGSGVVNFTPPLIQSYSAAALVQYQYLYMANHVGIEKVFFDNTVTNISNMLRVEGAAYPWIKECRFEKSRGAAVRMQYVVRPQFEGNYIYDGVAFTANAGIGIQMLRDVDSGLFRNNVFKKLFPHVEFQNSIDGNVFASNYYLEPQGGLAPIDNHGGHNVFNLFENEEAYGVVLDGYFGSAMNWTFHRCWFKGDETSFGARKMLNLGRFSRDINVVGTYLGVLNSGTNWVAEIVTNGWNNAWMSIGRYGYPNMGNDTYTATNTTFVPLIMGALDIGVKSNYLMHSTYSVTNRNLVGSVGFYTHDASLTNRTSPISLYVDWNSASSPSWYTNTPTSINWPAVAVEVDPLIVAGSYTTRNSARTWYEYVAAPPDPDPAQSSRYPWKALLGL